MMIAAAFIVLGLVQPVPEKAMESQIPRSGTRHNITIVFVLNSNWPATPERVNPATRLILDAKGRLFPGEGFEEVTDLTQLIKTSFGKRATTDFVLTIEDPKTTSLCAVPR